MTTRTAPPPQFRGNPTPPLLFGQHIRWSWFLRRPRDARGATVAACQHGGHALMLDASCDGYLPGLQVRLPWWTGPEMLLPGEGVTLYGRPGGAGRLLVSSSAWCRAFAGNGRRRPAPWVGEEIAQDVPHQPAGQRAERRYLQWGPQIVFGLGLVVAVTATLMAWDPPLTGHLGAGQLRTGDCLTGTNLGLGGDNPWPYMFTAVPCTGPHLAEVFFAGTAWPKSLTAYPGTTRSLTGGTRAASPRSARTTEPTIRYRHSRLMILNLTVVTTGHRVIDGWCVSHMSPPISTRAGHL